MDAVGFLKVIESYEEYWLLFFDPTQAPASETWCRTCAHHASRVCFDAFDRFGQEIADDAIVVRTLLRNLDTIHNNCRRFDNVVYWLP